MRLSIFLKLLSRYFFSIFERIRYTWLDQTNQGNNMLERNAEIPVIKTSEAANYPFIVQAQNTENWNTVDAYVSHAAAVARATDVLVATPGLKVRIAHHTGGHQPTMILPVWKQHDPAQYPYDLALWSNPKHPPAIGTTVSIPVNGLGTGVVTAYAVDRGYLAVMVQMHEETRALWDKKANPENKPRMAFGAEIEY